MGESRPNNRLLSLLPAADYARLQPQLQPVSLELKKVLMQPQQPIDYVYFPTRGMISSVTVMSDGACIEAATVGNEGASGASVALGEFDSIHRNLVQLPGEALRVSAKWLAKACSESTAMRQLLIKYHLLFVTQVSQSVACNGLHLIAQRCCRWLLVSHDRAQTDEIPLTHEFLAMMLSVRRPSVTLVLQPLQERGLIKCDRGAITILNRREMEVISCECYQHIQDEYARLLGVSAC
jgi:CRP-like cAMP-binding protein